MFNKSTIQKTENKKEYSLVPGNIFAKINNNAPVSTSLLTKITQNVFSETFKHTLKDREKMAQVFRPRSIIRALSRTHPELIVGSF